MDNVWFQLTRRRISVLKSHRKEWWRGGAWWCRGVNFWCCRWRKDKETISSAFWIRTPWMWCHSSWNSCCWPFSPPPHVISNNYSTGPSRASAVLFWTSCLQRGVGGNRRGSRLGISLLISRIGTYKPPQMTERWSDDVLTFRWKMHWGWHC